MEIARQMWKIYKGYRLYIGLMVAVVFAMQLMNGLSAYFMGKLLDAMNTGLPMAELIRLALLVFATSVVARVALPTTYDHVESKYVSFSIIGEAVQHILQRVFKLSIGQHIAEHSGRRNNVMRKGESALIGVSFAVALQIMPLVVMVLVYTSWMATKSIPIALATLSGILLHVLFIYKLNTKHKDDLKQASMLMHDDDKLEHEFIKHAPLVLVNSQQKRVFSEMALSWRKVLDFSIPFWVRYVWGEGRLRIFNPITGLVVLLIGLRSYQAGQMTSGDLVVCFLWATTALNQITSVCDLQRNIAKQVTDIRNLFEMLNEKPDVVEIENPIAPDFAGQIEFRNVSFAYKPRASSAERVGEVDCEAEQKKLPAVLHNVSFTIMPGERVAIVGRSGAGKSTIIQLLLRAYDPQSGEVLIDGHNLKDLSLSHYHRKLGLVEQGVQLFDKSLRYNVLFGCNDGEVSPEQLDMVCEAAGVKRFYDRLDHGLDTMLGERGLKLSGGQCQRVGIARALVKDPTFLVLDEATNSLDAENEMLITEAINLFGRNRTVLVIAHRLNTIKNCDKIIVVNDGRVASVGTHIELMASCEVYQTLVLSQMDKKQEEVVIQ